jgi:hypothetical protein
LREDITTPRRTEMAIDQKKRQKQLAKKAAKRKRVLAERRASQRRMDASSLKALISTAANSPVHECFVPRGIFDQGIGNVVVSRKMPDRSIAASFFLVDVFCLGVKDCFFTVVSKGEYEQRIAKLTENEDLERVEPEYAVKLIEDAVASAKNLGLNPPKDYFLVRNIFGNIDPSTCLNDFEFGKDGKPFYVSGPNETVADSRRIVDLLTKRLGPDGFDFLVGFDAGEDLDDMGGR